MKKFFSRLTTGILYSAIILLLVVIINSIYSAYQKKVPAYFGYSVLRILSNSMSDEFKAGDYILIKKVPSDSLKVNDIITFYSADPLLNGSPNTHRIVAVGDKSFTTKGDSNPVNDNYAVSFDKVVGKYQGKISIKILSQLFINKGYFLIFIILPLTIIIVSELVKIIKLKLEKEDDK